MIIFLFGPDTYRSKQRLLDIKREFIRKKDKKGFNVSVIQATDLTVDELRKVVLSSSLFSEKRLIIIKELLSKISKTRDSEEFKSLIEQIVNILKKTSKDKGLPAQAGLPDRRAGNVLIFWDLEIKEKELTPAQQHLYLLLRKEKYSEEFKFLSPAELKKWIKKQVSQQGLQIENSGINLLINIYGNNLWLLKNELDKLIAWQFKSEGQQKISQHDVENIALPKIEQNIWRLVDALGQKNKTQALKILSDQFKNEVNISEIITILAHQYRTILRIKSYIETNQVLNHHQLAKKLSLHPFVCQKGLTQEKNYTLEELKKIYQQLLKIDILRKTKKIDSKALLDLLIIKSLPC